MGMTVPKKIRTATHRPAKRRRRFRHDAVSPSVGAGPGSRLRAVLHTAEAIA